MAGSPFQTITAWCVGRCRSAWNLPAGSRFHLEVHGPGGVLGQTCHGVVEREFGQELLSELTVATRTPDGNACNWDTGLTAYAYGDQYGEGSAGLAGWHEISMTATLPDGSEVGDAVRVFVGQVVSFVYGNEVTSVDGRVTLSFPEHATAGPFTVYAIDPGSAVGPVSSWRVLASSPSSCGPRHFDSDNQSCRGAPFRSEIPEVSAPRSSVVHGRTTASSWGS